MILIKSAVKELEEIHDFYGPISEECFGVRVVCDIGKFKDCKIFLEELTTIDEKIIAKTIKKNIEKVINENS